MRGPVQPRAFRPRSACQPGGTDYQRFCSGIGKGPSMSHLSLEQRTQEGFELNTRQDFSIMRDVRPQRGRPNWDLPIQESPKMRFLRPRGMKCLLKPTRPVRTTPRTGISVFGSKSSTVSTTHRDCVWLCSPWRHPSHPGPCLTQRRCSSWDNSNTCPMEPVQLCEDFRRPWKAPRPASGMNPVVLLCSPHSTDGKIEALGR
ncbi:uncharacterized protein LOC123859782 isoform X2 [Mirounga angustirostris]|uniref:uncharacterized protein LOC123859782 isoform X2 n=1 Tax=Mirounga angustirostris TaxID=9716 RepID=UPI001E688CF3|nr:uncharacterized protein LOC123859782 isoform X3 [Mirounga angustirostris]